MALSIRELFFPPRRAVGSPPRSRPRPRPKPAYSPRTEQQITQAMFDLALAGPRYIGEQMGQDLDEAFEIGDTGISLKNLILHPIKTVKKTIRKWTIGGWQRHLSSQIVADYIWKPRLSHFSLTPQEEQTIYNWLKQPLGVGRDKAFDDVLAIRGQLDPDLWQGIQQQYYWDEFSQFRQRPGRYLWQKTFGRRGEKKGYFYRTSPTRLFDAVGKPVGRFLGNTSLGRAVAGVKQAAKHLEKQVVDLSKQAVGAVGKAAKRVVVGTARRVITRVAGAATWTAISSAVGGVVGSLGGPIGTVIGFLAGPLVTKLTEWFLKIACLGCGCLVIWFVALIALVVNVVGGAFHLSGPGGTSGVPGSTASVVQVQKTADKTHLDVDAGAVDPNERIVKFTITVKNLSDQEITEGRIVSEFDPTLFIPSALGGGSWDSSAGTLTWEGFSIPKGQTAEVRYDGFVDTNTDQVVVDQATFSGSVDANPVEAVATATVVIGTGGTELYPSGWPLAQGCLTQGPEGTESHRGLEALDIAPVNVLDIIFGDLAVYATHDGRAYAGRNRTYGYFVSVVSPLGFRTTYGHLNGGSIAITNGQQVYPGTYLGSVYKGIMGISSGTHLHYQVDGLNLRMEPPNIPAEVKRGCSGRDDCNLCFGG